MNEHDETIGMFDLDVDTTTATSHQLRKGSSLELPSSPTPPSTARINDALVMNDGLERLDMNRQHSDEYHHQYGLSKAKHQKGNQKGHQKGFKRADRIPLDLSHGLLQRSANKIKSSTKISCYLQKLLLNNNKIKKLELCNEGEYLHVSYGSTTVTLTHGKLYDQRQQCSELLHLDLSHNALSIFPSPTIMKVLLNLKTLLLGFNKIMSIAPESFKAIGDYNQNRLTTLDLSHNSITELPSTIGCCMGLKFLYLDQNYLKELPEEIVQLRGLDEGRCTFTGNDLSLQTQNGSRPVSWDMVKTYFRMMEQDRSHDVIHGNHLHSYDEEIQQYDDIKGWKFDLKSKAYYGDAPGKKKHHRGSQYPGAGKGKSGNGAKSAAKANQLQLFVLGNSNIGKSTLIENLQLATHLHSTTSNTQSAAGRSHSNSSATLTDHAASRANSTYTPPPAAPFDSTPGTTSSYSRSESQSRPPHIMRSDSFSSIASFESEYSEFGFNEDELNMSRRPSAIITNDVAADGYQSPVISPTAASSPHFFSGERRRNHHRGSQECRDLSTINIDICHWHPKKKHLQKYLCNEDGCLPATETSSGKGKKKSGAFQFEHYPDDVKFVVWDIRGEQEHHAIHEMLFNASALYLLLWDISECCTSEDFDCNVQFWIDLIQARAPGATIVIVGTKADLVEPSVAKQRTEMLRSQLAHNEEIRLQNLKNDIKLCEDEEKQRILENLKEKRPVIEEVMMYLSNTSDDIMERMQLLSFTLVSLATPSDKEPHPLNIIDAPIPSVYYVVKDYINHMRKNHNYNFCTVQKLHHFMRHNALPAKHRGDSSRNASKQRLATPTAPEGGKGSSSSTTKRKKLDKNANRVSRSNSRADRLNDLEEPAFDFPSRGERSHSSASLNTDFDSKLTFDIPPPRHTSHDTARAATEEKNENGKVNTRASGGIAIGMDEVKWAVQYWSSVGEILCINMNNNDGFALDSQFDLIAGITKKHKKKRRKSKAGDSKTPRKGKSHANGLEHHHPATASTEAVIGIATDDTKEGEDVVIFLNPKALVHCIKTILDRTRISNAASLLNLDDDGEETSFENGLNYTHRQNKRQSILKWRTIKKEIGNKFKEDAIASVRQVLERYNIIVPVKQQESVQSPKGREFESVTLPSDQSDIERIRLGARSLTDGVSPPPRPLGNIAKSLSAMDLIDEETADDELSDYLIPIVLPSRFEQNDQYLIGYIVLERVFHFSSFAPPGLITTIFSRVGKVLKEKPLVSSREEDKNYCWSNEFVQEHEGRMVCVMVSLAEEVSNRRPVHDDSDLRSESDISRFSVGRGEERDSIASAAGHGFISPLSHNDVDHYSSHGTFQKKYAFNNGIFDMDNSTPNVRTPSATSTRLIVRSSGHNLNLSHIIRWLDRYTNIIRSVLRDIPGLGHVPMSITCPGCLRKNTLPDGKRGEFQESEVVKVAAEVKRIELELRQSKFSDTALNAMIPALNKLEQFRFKCSKLACKNKAMYLIHISNTVNRAMEKTLKAEHEIQFLLDEVIRSASVPSRPLVCKCVVRVLLARGDKRAIDAVADIKFRLMTKNQPQTMPPRMWTVTCQRKSSGVLVRTPPAQSIPPIATTYQRVGSGDDSSISTEISCTPLRQGATPPIKQQGPLPDVFVLTCEHIITRPKKYNDNILYSDSVQNPIFFVGNENYWLYLCELVYKGSTHPRSHKGFWDICALRILVPIKPVRHEDKNSFFPEVRWPKHIAATLAKTRTTFSRSVPVTPSADRTNKQSIPTGSKMRSATMPRDGGIGFTESSDSIDPWRIPAFSESSTPNTSGKHAHAVASPSFQTRPTAGLETLIRTPNDSEKNRSPAVEMRPKSLGSQSKPSASDGLPPLQMPAPSTRVMRTFSIEPEQSPTPQFLSPANSGKYAPPGSVSADQTDIDDTNGAKASMSTMGMMLQPMQPSDISSNTPVSGIASDTAGKAIISESTGRSEVAELFPWYHSDGKGSDLTIYAVDVARRKVVADQLVRLLGFPGNDGPVSIDWGRVEHATSGQGLTIPILCDSGSSGGPLIDRKGMLLGLLSQSHEKQKYSEVVQLQDIFSILRAIFDDQ